MRKNASFINLSSCAHCDIWVVLLYQSADRWRGLGQAAGLHNFELHAFRATFQMVLAIILVCLWV